MRSEVSRVLLLSVLALGAAAAGCSGMRRSADEPPPSTPAPQAAPAAETARPEPAPATPESAFARAVRSTEEAAFSEAADLWKNYLDRFAGMPGFERAQYYYSLCLFNLGRIPEALEPIRVVLQDTKDARLLTDGRLLLAEILLAAGKFDEAIAVTYDLLPDRAAERRAGVRRAKKTPALNPTQKIRLFTLRGRIFASLRRESEATAALGHAEKLISGASASKVPPEERKKLTAAWAWRQIEVNFLSCKNKVKVPAKLSEAEFLAYADAHYDCAAPARSLFCKVLEARDEQIRSQALPSYRSLALLPLELKDHLPPPARPIAKAEQQSHYEREMKALIEETVTVRARNFRDLNACGAYDVF